MIKTKYIYNKQNLKLITIQTIDFLTNDHYCTLSPKLHSPEPNPLSTLERKIYHTVFIDRP